MTATDRHTFLQTIMGWTSIPHTQNDAWCMSQVSENNMRYLLDDAQPHNIACAAYVRRKIGFTMLCVQGLCLRQEPDIKQLTAFFSQLRQQPYDIIEVNLNHIYSPLWEIAMREAGWLRPIGMFSTTLSKHIHLQQPLQFDKSWQRNIKKAEQQTLDFQIYQQPPQTLLQQYMQLHNEMIQRKHFNGYLSQEQLFHLMDDPHFLLSVVSHPDHRIVAALVSYADDSNHAISLYSVTSPIGRSLSASYLLYKKTFEYLAAKGVTTYDLGRLAPSDQPKNSVFLFKNGVNGTHVQYMGEWLSCRCSWMPLAHYLLCKYVWKRTQV